MKWNEARGTLGIMAAVLALMAFGGGAAFFYGNTLVEWWLPLTISVCGGLLFWVLLRGRWERRWPETYGWLRFATHMLLFTAGMAFVVLGGNYAGADDSTLHEEEVRVERKYREKRYRSRRVGRGRYTRGEPYYIYKVEVGFSDGRRKEFSVPLSRFNEVRSGGALTLRLERGLLGWPVVRRGSGG